MTDLLLRPNRARNKRCALFLNDSNSVPNSVTTLVWYTGVTLPCDKRSYVVRVQMPAAIVFTSENPTRMRLQEHVAISSDTRNVQELRKIETVAKHYLSLCLESVRR